MDSLSKQLLAEWELAGMSANKVQEYKKRAQAAKYDWRELLYARKIDEASEHNLPLNLEGSLELEALTFGTPTELQLDVTPRVQAQLVKLIFDPLANSTMRLDAIKAFLGLYKKDPSVQNATTIINQTNVIECSDEVLLKIVNQKRAVLSAPAA